jgi:hypothetical protein
MATMGRRKLDRKNGPGTPDMGAVGIAAPSVNLGAIPTTIVPVSTLDVQPSFLGGPIMREGFITATGSVPPKVE